MFLLFLYLIEIHFLQRPVVYRESLLLSNVWREGGIPCHAESYFETALFVCGVRFLWQMLLGLQLLKRDVVVIPHLLYPNPASRC